MTSLRKKMQWVLGNGQIVLEGLRVVGIETVVEQIAEVESGQGKKR